MARRKFREEESRAYVADPLACHTRRHTHRVDIPHHPRLCVCLSVCGSVSVCVCASVWLCGCGCGCVFVETFVCTARAGHPRVAPRPALAATPHARHPAAATSAPPAAVLDCRAPGPVPAAPRCGTSQARRFAPAACRTRPVLVAAAAAAAVVPAAFPSPGCCWPTHRSAARRTLTRRCCWLAAVEVEAAVGVAAVAPALAPTLAVQRCLPRRRCR